MLEFNLPAKIVRFGVLRLLFDLFGKHMSHLSFPDSVFLFDNDGRSLGERLVVNQCFSIFKNIIFVVFVVNFKAGEPITDRTLKKKIFSMDFGSISEKNRLSFNIFHYARKMYEVVLFS